MLDHKYRIECAWGSVQWYVLHGKDLYFNNFSQPNGLVGIGVEGAHDPLQRRTAVLLRERENRAV